MTVVQRITATCPHVVGAVEKPSEGLQVFSASLWVLSINPRALWVITANPLAVVGAVDKPSQGAAVVQRITATCPLTGLRWGRRQWFRGKLPLVFQTTLKLLHVHLVGRDVSEGQPQLTAVGARRDHCDRRRLRVRGLRSKLALRAADKMF